ncbi:kelch-like protein 10 [Styela clava]
MALESSLSNSSFSTEEWKPSSDAWLTFNDFRHQGLFCDVVLRVEDVRFPVHRLVLCACSDYFRSLFVGGWKSSDKQEIEIPGISPEMMSSLLNFAYTGQVVITAHNVQELLPAADQFQIMFVKEKCCSFLKRQLSATNCVGIRKYAEWFFCAKLQKAATEYILNNFEEMSKKSPEYLLLSYDEVYALISDDRLNVRVEEIVCEAVFRWIRSDRHNRIQYLQQLLQSVRLGLLDPEYFMTKVKGNDLVMERIKDCRVLVKEAMQVVCDLHSPESDIRMANSNAYHRLLRPRLPNEILLAVGGWSGGCSTNAIEAYDPRAETWVNISSMPGLVEERPRAYHGVAYLNKCVYIIGGFDGVNYFNTMRKFNVQTNDWIQEPSMFHKRCYVSVTMMGGRIYALGGMDGEHRLNTGESYDPIQRVWTILPDMNERRSDASAAALGNKVYISGGFNGQECLFTAEFYDLDSLSWTRITPMRSRRSGVSIIALHGMIYAVGGFDGINRLRSAEAYCPVTNTWRSIATMNKPRSNFGMDVIDDQIIAVGGFNGHQTSADVEVYDDTTNEWYEVREMHIFRSALSCCVISGLSHDVIKKFCVSRELNNVSRDGGARRAIALSTTNFEVQAAAAPLAPHMGAEEDISDELQSDENSDEIME